MRFSARSWKTKVGALGLLCTAVLQYAAGDIIGALQAGAAALAAVGIGHKIEKAGQL